MKGFNSIRLFMTDRKSILREVGNTPINIICTHTVYTVSRIDFLGFAFQVQTRGRPAGLSVKIPPIWL